MPRRSEERKRVSKVGWRVESFETVEMKVLCMTKTGHSCGGEGGGTKSVVAESGLNYPFGEWGRDYDQSLGH